VFPIHLPPLREREGDMELLADHFLRELNNADGLAKYFAPAARRLMAGHHWPGNVRELKNVVHRAYILADVEITRDCLPADIGVGMGAKPGSGAAGSVLHVRVGTSVAQAERSLILATLEELGGDKPKTAEVLGISLKTLYNRLDAYRKKDAAPRGAP
jgi:DNA-binding NtrC family response regulator